MPHITLSIFGWQPILIQPSSTILVYLLGILMIAITPTVKGSAVRIRSECSMTTQLVDWGKNKKNIERFAQELERLLGAPVYEG
jgi:hypothetical protein